MNIYFGPEQASYLASVANAAGRPEDAIEYLLSITRTSKLTSADQNLLVTLIQGVVTTLRHSCDDLHKEWVTQIALGDNRLADLADRAQLDVEEELRKMCKKVMHLIEAHLLPRAIEAEDEVFYLKMYADYARYLLDCTADDPDSNYSYDSASHIARAHYHAAASLAESSLSPCHPLRLGIALNRGVLYVSLGDRTQGLEFTQAAFDAALQVVMNNVQSDTWMQREGMEDTIAGMDMLSDNYSLWTGEGIELTTFEPMPMAEYQAKETVKKEEGVNEKKKNGPWRRTRRISF